MMYGENYSSHQEASSANLVLNSSPVGPKPFIKLVLTTDRQLTTMSM